MQARTALQLLFATILITMIGVTTNLVTTCRVLLPNSGGLLVKDNGAMDSHGTNYWLIISPAAVDARGLPKNL